MNVADHVNIVSHTSHPHILNDGTIYNLGLSVTKKGPAYSIIEFSTSSFTQGKILHVTNPTIFVTLFLFLIENHAKKRKHSMFHQARIIAKIPARWMFNPSYMHTFGITENFFIIVEQPLAISIPSMLSNRLKNEPMYSALKWHKNENVNIVYYIDIIFLMILLKKTCNLSLRTI